METAKSDNKLIVATDIAKNYALESEIRRSSRNRLLRCPDPDCTAPVVKYCHGDKRLPYFSHIENDDCDYAKFDQSENEVFKNVRRTFYSHLKENGFVVTPEVKVLKHHYTHLLFEYEDHKIAVEFGSNQTTIGNVDQLNNQYDKAAIHVNWICVDHTEKYFEEDTTFFLKRYGLNDSNNKSILVVG